MLFILQIREKMLYAGTRTTMKLEFGGGHIADEIFATLKVCILNHSFYKFTFQSIYSLAKSNLHFKKNFLRPDLNIVNRNLALLLRSKAIYCSLFLQKDQLVYT